MFPRFYFFRNQMDFLADGEMIILNKNYLLWHVWGCYKIKVRNFFALCDFCELLRRLLSKPLDQGNERVLTAETGPLFPTNFLSQNFTGFTCKSLTLLLNILFRPVSFSFDVEFRIHLAVIAPVSTSSLDQLLGRSASEHLVGPCFGGWRLVVFVREKT